MNLEVFNGTTTTTTTKTIFEIFANDPLALLLGIIGIVFGLAIISKLMLSELIQSNRRESSKYYVSGKCNNCNDETDYSFVKGENADFKSVPCYNCGCFEVESNKNKERLTYKDEVEEDE